MKSLHEMTPIEAVRYAETSMNLTLKERQKVLAIAFYHQQVESPPPKKGFTSVQEIEILWGFSKSVISSYGYGEIQEFNPEFVLEINTHPELFIDYK